MARDTKTSCSRCDARLGVGPYCPKCGYPTPYASHEDRVEWELRQWGAPNAAAMVASTPMKPSTSVAAEVRTRRWFKARNGAQKAQSNGALGTTNGHGEKPAEQVVATNGHGVKPAEQVVPANGDAHADGSPFAPPAEAVNTLTMKTSRTKQSKAPEPTTPAKPKAVRKKPAAAKGEAEKPKARSMRAPSRLPSAADVEAVAEQGPPIVKILRLIQLRAALLEAQAADEDVAQTG